MSLTTITDAAFGTEVLASSTPVLVDFTADWCPPCKMVEPVLEQIATEEAGRLKVVSIDVDANPVTTLTYGILSMPTLALFVDGQIVTQLIGAKPRAVIMRSLEAHLQPVAG
ncbi:MAG TPA: thioredoxin [Kineosporiaceae bacterium]|nr:thioredoxin [Kineosporiaceae bacterium]